MRYALPLLWCIGCGWPPGVPGPAPQPLELEPPVIDSFALGCDVDDGRWTLDATTAWWTGGGRLLWRADGDWIESHRVPSVSAAPDGSDDELHLDLAIVSDWREASPGSSTAVRCALDPDWVFVVSDVQGELADCRAGGPDPQGFQALEGIPSCDVLVPDPSPLAEARPLSSR